MPDPSDSSRRIAAAHSCTPNWLKLDVVEDRGNWGVFGLAGSLVVDAGAALARHEKFKNCDPADACVSLSDAATVRRLNARYRGIDRATNVLSFPPAAGFGEDPEGRKYLGDVVLAQEVVAQEAAEQTVFPAHHLQHLVIHGLLHLLGFDHESERDATVMETLEIEILSSLGISNPYSGPLTRVEPADLSTGQML